MKNCNIPFPSNTEFNNQKSKQVELSVFGQKKGILIIYLHTYTHIDILKMEITLIHLYIQLFWRLSENI